MSYLICYYRPANRFPDHFFGGVAKNINNPVACSIDDFAYFHSRIAGRSGSLPARWSLTRAEYEDMAELGQFYEQYSGGLMLKSLDLVPEKEMTVRRDLSDAYQEMGLRRERRVYVLKQDNLVKAVLMANISDFALNLSDLTNCISLFVIDQSTPYEVLHQSVFILGELYDASKIPVLLFPRTYADAQGVKYDRIYSLWVLDMQYTDDFFKNYNYLK